MFKSEQNGDSMQCEGAKEHTYEDDSTVQRSNTYLVLSVGVLESA